MGDTTIPTYTHPQTSLVRPAGESSAESKTKNENTEARVFKEAPTKRELTFKEKLKKSFVKEDLKDIGEYLLFDLIIPGIKRNMWEMVVGTASRALGISIPAFSSFRPFDQTSSGYSPYNDSRYRSYDLEAARNRNSNRILPTRQRYDIYQTNTITFQYKDDAQIMLNRLLEVARTHPYVSVHTFYSLAQVMDGNEYTNGAYGWPSQLILNEADIDNEGYGYYISLPDPKELPRGLRR